MFKGIMPAIDSKTVPVVRSAQFQTGQTFIKGAVLGLTAAAGEVLQLASDPAAATTCFGVALEGVNTKPGFQVANDNQVIFRTGTVQEVSMVDLEKKPDQIFSARFTNGAGVDVAPVQADIGDIHGLLLLGTGEWTVNQADATGAARIADIILNLGAAAAGNRVLFKFEPPVATVLS